MKNIEKRLDELYQYVEEMDLRCKADNTKRYELEKENERLQSNWNSLKEWLEILINSNLYSLSFKEPLRNVLDKMNELERER